MPGYLNETLNVTEQEIIQLANVTDVPSLAINVNNIVYDGVLFFIILWIIWYILFIVTQKIRDQPLNNMMYAAAACTLLGFLLRVLTLLTDHQMWVFPIITIILAVVIWAIKHD